MHVFDRTNAVADTWFGQSSSTTLSVAAAICIIFEGTCTLLDHLHVILSGTCTPLTFYSVFHVTDILPHFISIYLSNVVLLATQHLSDFN